MIFTRLKIGVQTIKKCAGEIVIATALAGLYHILDPTLLFRAWNILKDPFETTAIERKIEEEFGIDYEGDSRESTQQTLLENLHTVKQTHPKLLEHCRKITVHSDTTLHSKLVKACRYFDGRAFPYFNSIELTTTDLDTLVHELAHVLHFNTLPEFDREMNAIFGHDYGKDLKPSLHFGIINLPTEWWDGYNTPRNGFVGPYGAKDKYENVATYVEKTLDETFWEKPELQKSPRYKQAITILNKYGLITQKQYQQTHASITLNNSELLSQTLEQAVQNLQPPHYIKKEDWGEGTTLTLYKDDAISIDHTMCMGGTNLVLTIPLDANRRKSFCLERHQTTKKLQTCYEPDKAIVSPTILERLTELGYDKIFDFETYIVLAQPK